MKVLSILLFSLAWLAVHPVLAQAPSPGAIVTGRVLDAKTGEPLPFATVYLNNSSRGTTADDLGQYRLTNLPLGNQELVSSVLGYETLRQPIRLTDSRSRTIDLRLEPGAQSLASVTVTARRSGAWARQFRTFSRELLGSRPQARQCRISNPNALRFEEEKGHLRAQASEPLIIENEALGYRIYYTLLHFDLYQGKLLFAGTSRFEELTPVDNRQRVAWQTNRQKAYRGSLHHLLASLLAGTHEQDGYVLYRTPLVVDGSTRSLPLVRTTERQYLSNQQAQALFRPGELPFERQLISRDPLEVYYNRVYAGNSPYRDSPYAYSMLLLPKGSFDLTTDGWITQGNGLDVRGYLGNDRLATLLPADWIPADRETLSATDIVAGKVVRPNTGLDSLVASRQRQYRRTPPIVYMHTDKNLYSTGDQLWLSAYVLDPARQLPIAGRSGTTLQVELIAPNGQSVQHQWLRLTDGRASGSFRLADTLASGMYRLHAYTDLDQVSNGPAFACSFPVVSNGRPAQDRLASRRVPPPASAEGTHVPSPDSVDVQFLAEGGRWLAGVPGRLGIKAIRFTGRGFPAGGRIVDQAGVDVARFKTNALGIGQVVMTPQAGQRYVALVESGTGGLIQRVVLPPVETDSWALSADAVTDSSRLTVRVRATGRYQEQPVYITLQSQEQLVYRQQWQLPRGEAQFSLSTATLPPGVCRLTLWDAAGVPRAERLVFVPERNGLVQMRVITAKDQPRPRKPMGISLQFRDADAYPVAATWSGAVTDADQLPGDTTQPDLRTYLLLTGGLRGPVESPNHYMDPEHAADLDNLLLTQGWRRLPAPEEADSTGGWTLSGRAYAAKGYPLTRKSVLVQFERKGEKMTRLTETNDAGLFRLTGLFASDTVQVRARVLDAGMTNIILTFDQPGKPFPIPVVAEPDWKQLTPWIMEAARRQTAWPALYRDSTARQLAEVVVRAPKPASTLMPERPKDVERSSLHGSADATIVVDQNPTFLSMNSVFGIISRLPGVQVSGTYVTVRGYGTFGDNSVLYLIDGVYADEEQVETLNPRMVDRIELLTNAATAGMYGARGGSGVIAIFTKKGSNDPIDAPTSVAATVQGFASPREFYVPRYEMAETASATDRRDVLFWEPLGKSGSDGLANLYFPLSDTAQRLRIVVQGVTVEGIPISFTWVLPVR